MTTSHKHTNYLSDAYDEGGAISFEDDPEEEGKGASGVPKRCMWQVTGDGHVENCGTGRLLACRGGDYGSELSLEDPTAHHQTDSCLKWRLSASCSKEGEGGVGGVLVHRASKSPVRVWQPTDQQVGGKRARLGRWKVGKKGFSTFKMVYPN